MLDFEKYVTQRGEFWVQDLVERLERYEGIQANHRLSLEERWDALMHTNLGLQRIAA